MLKRRRGPCVSKERCLEILEEEVQDHLPEEKWENYEKSVNRVRYEFKKLDGAKPELHKGRYIKDFYTCRNCRAEIDVGHNFCPNCGWKLQWDGIRWLTDRKG